ncbi:MAG: N-acetylneuraminate lyase, partial [Pseudomonadota bacterium]
MTNNNAILAAMLTPFEEDGSVAADGIPPLVDYILGQGVHGLYVGGSTGECVLQSREERALVLTKLAAYARGKCTLVAHVGAASTEDAIALADLAAREGYDAVSAVPPFYYKHRFDDIVDYYKAIADAACLPLIVYNIPALSGANLSTDQLLHLISDERIGGMKYTATDLFQFAQLRRAAPNKSFYFGTDEMFLGAAAIGTDGGIGSTYNLIGDIYVGIHKAVEAGEIDDARRLQAKSNSLVEILFETGVMPGLKYALRRQGIPVGPCRRPFSPPAPAALAKLDQWMVDHLQR